MGAAGCLRWRHPMSKAIGQEQTDTKAGKRHSSGDVDKLRQVKDRLSEIDQLLVDLGLEPAAAEPAEESGDPAAAAETSEPAAEPVAEPAAATEPTGGKS